MTNYIDKKDQSKINGTVQRQHHTSAFQFTDNRPQATVQRKLQTMVHNGLCQYQKRPKWTLQMKGTVNPNNGQTLDKWRSKLPSPKAGVIQPKIVVQRAKVKVEDLEKGSTYYFRYLGQPLKTEYLGTTGGKILFETNIPYLGILMLPGKIGQSYQTHPDLLPEFFNAPSDIGYGETAMDDSVLADSTHPPSVATARVDPLSESDKAELIEFMKDLSSRAKNGSILRRMFPKLVKEGKTLAEIKSKLTESFIPKESRKPASGVGSVEKVHPPELMRLLEEGDLTDRNAVSFIKNYEHITDQGLSSVQHQRAVQAAYQKHRVDQHGLLFEDLEMPTTESTSPFTEFIANLQKFFPIEIPKVALELIASHLVSHVSNDEIKNCLLIFHTLPRVFTAKPYKEEMNERLKQLVGPRLGVLPPKVIAKIELALVKTPAAIVDPFHYTFEILKEELRSLQSNLTKQSPSPAACRLTANAIFRAINVSSGRFLPKEGKTFGKLPPPGEGNEKIERIMVHETIHAANEEVEYNIQQQLSPIFAEVFTEITANYILDTPPTAYQGFVPLGKAVIAKVYGSDMKAFLSAFFSGDMSGVRLLFTEEDIAKLKRVDSDEHGLTTFTAIVKKQLGK